MKPVLDERHFHSENAAFAYLEARIWPDGPVCPHCGGVDRISKMRGKSTRIGVYKCYQCRKPFRVTVGTVFESSHVPLRLWLQAVHLIVSSKKGISSNQLHRVLGVTLKTAWFMAHRIREAMSALNMEPMGGDGQIVEADETFLGDMDRHRSRKGKKGIAHKRKVLTLIQRGGKARSFHVEDLKASIIAPIVWDNIAKASTLSTDEARHYRRLGKAFAKHIHVEHNADEYVRGDAHVNTAEGFFSIFKRGMKGIYQHCAEKHLHRYLAEFDFRYSNRVALGIDDVARADLALQGIVGKRLTYRTPH